MNTHDLEAFIAVVETGSIVAAGARLNLTQPGVTRRIQNLEGLLGAVLLDRNAKPLRPTAAGRDAYDLGRRVIQGVEDLRSEVAPQKDVRGELRLGFGTYLPERRLCDAIDDVRRLHSELGLYVVATWAPSLLDQVQRGELDAAFVCLADGTAPPEALLARDLGTQRAFFVASSRADVAPIASVAELARQPWVVSQDGCGFRASLRRRFDTAHLAFRIAVEAPSLDLRMALIARGIGLGIATAGSVADEKWAGSIRIVEAMDFQPRVRCWLVQRRALGRLEQPLEVFRDAVAAMMGDDRLSEAA